MIEIICLLFPALFSVFALERLLGKKLNLRNFAFVFVTNTLLINLTGLFLMFCFSGSASMPLSSANGIHVRYSLAYLVIVAVVTCLTVFGERFYFYRLRISVSDMKNEEKKSEKNDSKKGKKL